MTQELFKVNEHMKLTYDVLKLAQDFLKITEEMFENCRRFF